MKKLIIFVLCFASLVFAEDLLTKKQRCLGMLNDKNFYDSMEKIALLSCASKYSTFYTSCQDDQSRPISLVDRCFNSVKKYSRKYYDYWSSAIENKQEFNDCLTYSRLYLSEDEKKAITVTFENIKSTEGWYEIEDVVNKAKQSYEKMLKEIHPSCVLNNSS